MKRIWRAILTGSVCVALLVLILDSKTALECARDGLKLCGYTVIPSLFPFFVISALLTDTLAGRSLPIFAPLRRLCKMPDGSESLLVVGLLGGYPIGAKCIYDLWKRGQLTEEDAKRCLGFCNNAGPAFIFGMCGVLFSGAEAPWVLWVIHIASALITGAILPKKAPSKPCIISQADFSLPKAMTQSVTAMLSVCGWVILFRIIIGFAQRWFLWLLPATWQIGIAGILELTNGCTALVELKSEGIRFILCSLFLSLGGLCVGLQTVSVVGQLGTGMYFPGKVIQSILSTIMAVIFLALKYRAFSPTVSVIAILALPLFILVLKKTVAFPGRLVYNVEKACKGGFLCYSGKKSRNPVVIVPVEPK